MNSFNYTINFIGIIDGKQYKWSIISYPQELIKDLLSRFYDISSLDKNRYKIYINNIDLSKFSSQTLFQMGLINNTNLQIVDMIPSMNEYSNMTNKNVELEGYIVNECYIKSASEKQNQFDNSYNKSQNNNLLNNNKNDRMEECYKSSSSYPNLSLPINIPKKYQEIGNKIYQNFKVYIKFIKSHKKSMFDCYRDLHGLLKLCLLNEISSKFNPDNLNIFKTISEIAYFIMTILNKSYITNFDLQETKENIKQILEKIDGRNVINFSNFVEEEISSQNINQMMNFLPKKNFIEINDLKMRLGKYSQYISFFEKQFENSLRESIFEFSVVSLIILDREDFDIFETERSKCQNRVDRILYHGTQIEPISCILTDLFKRSEDAHYQHGKGVYFTDNLDYCWFYGGTVNNRYNKNKIPKVNDTFTALVNLVYYNDDGYLKVNNYTTRIQPGKNEINFAYAGCDFETIESPDLRKFYGTEYVVWDLNQICPFISIKFKRNEYCVIWRDINFSEKNIYGDKFDKIFKNFLKERMKYIKQVAKYNVYPCKTTDEALNLVNRKKYNKIILLSNVGADLGGKKFVDEARKIIGNNVIVLFLAYNIDHLSWIKNYKNAIFSNDPKFYEKYLDCFNMPDPTLKIQNLIYELENYYETKFNFDNNFLYFPYYKIDGKYSDLYF